MKGEIRPAFSYSPPYPLATLPIDNDILEDKWALTHPAPSLSKRSGKHVKPRDESVRVRFASELDRNFL